MEKWQKRRLAEHVCRCLVSLADRWSASGTVDLHTAAGAMLSTFVIVAERYMQRVAIANWLHSVAAELEAGADEETEEPTRIH